MRALIIVLLFFVVVQPVSAASFDCAVEHLKPAEKVVCFNRELSKLDDEMMKIYKKVRQTPALRNEQKSWLRFRNNCGFDVLCLKRAYIGRIYTLRIILGGTMLEKYEPAHHKGH